MHTSTTSWWRLDQVDLSRPDKTSPWNWKRGPDKFARWEKARVPPDSGCLKCNLIEFVTGCIMWRPIPGSTFLAQHLAGCTQCLECVAGCQGWAYWQSQSCTCRGCSAANIKSTAGQVLRVTDRKRQGRWRRRERVERKEETMLRPKNETGTEREKLSKQKVVCSGIIFC